MASDGRSGPLHEASRTPGDTSKRLQVVGDVCACVALAACSVVAFLVFVWYLIHIEGWITTMPLR